MRLLDYADGVKGHFCIGRTVGCPAYWEFYNRGDWVSAGQVFKTKKAAQARLKRLTQYDAAGDPK